MLSSLFALALTVFHPYLQDPTNVLGTGGWMNFSFRVECGGGLGGVDGPFWPQGDDGLPLGDNYDPITGTYFPHGAIQTGFCGHEVQNRGGLIVTHQYGHPFSILSFESPTIAEVTSSKGGLEVIFGGTADDEIRQEYSGAEWTDISWLYINPCYADDVGCHQTGVFANFYLATQVPEPVPVALLLPALGLLALRKRRS